LDSIALLLTLTTAAIHLVRAAEDPAIRLWFTLNGLGYLGLLMLLYLPRFVARRTLARTALMIYTGATVALWVLWGLVSGEWTALGVFDKAVEMTLIGLLWGQLRRSGAAESG